MGIIESSYPCIMCSDYIAESKISKSNLNCKVCKKSCDRYIICNDCKNKLTYNDVCMTCQNYEYQKNMIHLLQDINDKLDNLDY